MDTTLGFDKEMNKQLDSMELTYIKVTKYVDEKVLGVCRQINKLASIVVPDTVVIDDNSGKEFELNKELNEITRTLVTCLTYFNPDGDVDVDELNNKVTEQSENKSKKTEGVNKFFTYTRQANEGLSVIHEVANAFCNTLGLDTVFESNVKNSENIVKPSDNNSWRDSIIYQLGMLNIQANAISQCLNNIQVDIDNFQSALSKVIDQCTDKPHQGIDLSPLDRTRY